MHMHIGFSRKMALELNDPRKIDMPSYKETEANQTIYIYIYIYICVCVCVCVWITFLYTIVPAIIRSTISHSYLQFSNLCFVK